MTKFVPYIQIKEETRIQIKLEPHEDDGIMLTIVDKNGYHLHNILCITEDGTLLRCGSKELSKYGIVLNSSNQIKLSEDE